MDLEIPWLKWFDEKPTKDPDDDKMEQVDYEVMLEELEFK